MMTNADGTQRSSEPLRSSWEQLIAYCHIAVKHLCFYGDAYICDNPSNFSLSVLASEVYSCFGQSTHNYEMVKDLFVCTVGKGFV